MLELKELLPANKEDIFVTKVVQIFTFPFAICPAIVELFTTV
jgi:hypothetical protein